MDLFSKKYNKWFRCDSTNQHPRHLSIYKFGDFYWRSDVDKLIHKDIVDEYIDNCKKRSNRYKKDAYCKKNGIEIKD